MSWKKFEQFVGNVIAGSGASVTINGQTWTGGSGPGTNGEGPVVTQERKLEDFDRINTSVMCNLVVTVGPPVLSTSVPDTTDDDPYRMEAPSPDQPYRVVVCAQENLQEILKTEVRGTTLHLWTKASFSTNERIEIAVCLPRLVGLSSSGHGTIEVEGLHGERFELDHSGMGNLFLQGSTTHLAADISGHGTVSIRDLHNHSTVINHSGMGSLNAAGSTGSLVATLSGHGTINFQQFPAPWLHLMASGMGSVRVRATQSAKGLINGHGTTYVYGNPSDWNVRHTGMGSVKFM